MLSGIGGKSRRPSCKTALRYGRGFVDCAEMSVAFLKVDLISSIKVCLAWWWVSCQGFGTAYDDCHGVCDHFFLRHCCRVVILVVLKNIKHHVWSVGFPCKSSFNVLL